MNIRDDKDNSILFFKIWRNIVLKNKILKICLNEKEIYEKLMVECEKNLIFSPLSLLKYKYRDYLTNISISNISHLYDVKINSNTEDNIQFTNQDLYSSLHKDNNTPCIIKKGTIPSGVKSIRILAEIGIEYDSIPPSVKSISFVGKLVPFKSQTWIPSTLVELNMGNNLNFRLSKGDFPLDDHSNLEILKLPNNYSFHPIPNNVYPKSIKEIHFGDIYNTFFKSNSFPLNVEKLFLGSKYSKPLESDGQFLFLPIQTASPILPLSLVHLEFSVDSVFNEIIKPIQLNYLSNLRELVFGNDFNREIQENTFPENLQVLRFGKNFNNSLLNRLPNKLKILEFAPDSQFNQKLDDNISGKTLPNTLEFLKIGNQFTQPFHFPLPDTLKELHIGDNWNQILNINSNSSLLETINLGDSFNQPINGTLIELKSLQKVVFGLNFNKPLCLSLFSKNIIRFKYGTKFDQSGVHSSDISYFYMYPNYNNKFYPNE